MNYKLEIHQDEDGVFVASCLDLPGCFSQGKTYEEAEENIKDAIEGYLESVSKHGDTIN